MPDIDAKIRQEAYHIWEREGRPDGRERDHWEQAVRELGLDPSEVTPATANSKASGAARKMSGKPDAKLVAAGQPYEVGYFAKKHGITRRQAKDLIDRIGNDRDALNEAAAKLKSKR